MFIIELADVPFEDLEVLEKKLGVNRSDFLFKFPIFIASNYCLMFLYSQTRYHLVLAFLTFLLLLDAFLSYLKFNVECKRICLLLRYLYCLRLRGQEKEHNTVNGFCLRGFYRKE